MNDRLDPAHHAWMISAEARTVTAALEAAQGEARFVGGAVRNSLLGESVSDIDIATTLTPGDAVAALKAKNITVAPTGIEHGTVTAVVNGRPFEVTSLRRDVSTDGRRATVAFTSDWAQDAARRDFTMNAIYADKDGRLFDPTGGVSDLRAGLVRFVGDPGARIREDYLRILRYFRFYAWYGRGEPDEKALAAATLEKAGLKRLSGERVQKELLRLLEAPDPVPALDAMRAREILAQIVPEPVDLERLAQLVRLTRELKIARDPVLSLAAVLNSADRARTLASNLKLSNADRMRLVEALAQGVELEAGLSLAEARRVLYRFGADRFRDCVLLRWSGAPAEPGWQNLLDIEKDWVRPEFPVDGLDAIGAGVPEGPQVGRILALLERWWVEHDFAPERAALLAKLKELVR
jgi:poly(A) polymerase